MSEGKLSAVDKSKGDDLSAKHARLCLLYEERRSAQKRLATLRRAVAKEEEELRKLDELYNEARDAHLDAAGEIEASESDDLDSLTTEESVSEEADIDATLKDLYPEIDFSDIGPPSDVNKTPTQDPITRMLVARAKNDEELKEIMKVLAAGQATAEQLREFQAHIDEIKASSKGKRKRES
ncbi:hypothetical protein BKA66DRAFT_567458 [Pyrenochaeta sp. MPI-SDFR-AT-0127]|nr:hypothetical protein BKA66DRAFT_567458 [Pyrenochaeta sp. MPI-SDFR-AT-0127]